MSRGGEVPQPLNLAGKRAYILGPRQLDAHAPWCNLAADHDNECGHMNDQHYNAVPNPAYSSETHWCNYCDAMTDHLSSGHPGKKPSWTIVDSHMCTRCGFLDRSRDGIMAHLAACGEESEPKP